MIRKLNLMGHGPFRKQGDVCIWFCLYLGTMVTFSVEKNQKCELALIIEAFVVTQFTNYFQVLLKDCFILSFTYQVKLFSSLWMTVGLLSLRKENFIKETIIKCELGERCYCCQCQEIEKETKEQEEVSLLFRHQIRWMYLLSTISTEEALLFLCLVAQHLVSFLMSL